MGLSETRCLCCLHELIFVFGCLFAVCRHFSRNVYSMVGAVSPDSFDTLHSYSNTFQMPFVTAWFPEQVQPPSSGSLDYAISMRPEYHQAIIDVVRYYNWKRVIYLYDSHEGQFTQNYLKLPSLPTDGHELLCPPSTHFLAFRHLQPEYPGTWPLKAQR